ncbi:HAD family hydrolase [Chondromyces crocatus]|uniref:Haloacid dehalogenase n=1 Tax=Chondromyces crocatus TaxID=52 RepID=A0A0K1E8W0_CHOCO|nr:HAD family phosphatase [Chondromyces crocatus]AKT37294.1 haloacid dehalogenase [Chondromyces crocatus]
MDPAFAPLRGVVFDMNGTLVDDIPFHFAAWRSLASELGVLLSDEDLQSFNGLKNEDILPKLVGSDVTPERAARLIEQKEETYRRLYRPHLALMDGAREFLAALRAGSVRVAIASSAPPENRAMVIDGLQLRDDIDVVVAAEHLPGKPAPDVFLDAARQLGIAPFECLAFEDAVSGVMAAVRAGMLVGAVTTNNPAATLLAAGAAFAVHDFTCMPPEVSARLPQAPR